MHSFFPPSQTLSLSLVCLWAVGSLSAPSPKLVKSNEVFRYSGDDASSFDHQQFWVDKGSNEIEGSYRYTTPEGEDIETRFGEL